MTTLISCNDHFKNREKTKEIQELYSLVLADTRTAQKKMSNMGKKVKKG